MLAQNGVVSEIYNRAPAYLHLDVELRLPLGFSDRWKVRSFRHVWRVHRANAVDRTWRQAVSTAGFGQHFATAAIRPPSASSALRADNEEHTIRCLFRGSLENMRRLSHQFAVFSISNLADFVAFSP